MGFGRPSLGWWILAGLWLAGLFLLAPFDLAISQEMARLGDPFGRLVAVYGEWPAWVGVLVCVFGWLRARAGHLGWQPWRPLFRAVILQSLIHPLAITQAFKFLWGRVRFVHLTLPGWENYTPFYLPAGPGAGESFPSGHVAMAFVLAPLPLFLLKSGKMRLGGCALIGVLAYGLAVAYGRILAGAHSATDCFFSFGLAFLLAHLLIRERQA